MKTFLMGFACAMLFSIAFQLAKINSTLHDMAWAKCEYEQRNP